MREGPGSCKSRYGGLWNQAFSFISGLSYGTTLVLPVRANVCTHALGRARAHPALSPRAGGSRHFSQPATRARHGAQVSRPRASFVAVGRSR
jgi:hypothetical protein